MAKYIKQEFKSINDDSENKAYYRMETSRRVTMAEFVKEISIPGYGISEATAVQVLSQAVYFSKMDGFISPEEVCCGLPIIILSL